MGVLRSASPAHWPKRFWLPEEARSTPTRPSSSRRHWRQGRSCTCHAPELLSCNQARRNRATVSNSHPLHLAHQALKPQLVLGAVPEQCTTKRQLHKRALKPQVHLWAGQELPASSLPSTKHSSPRPHWGQSPCCKRIHHLHLSSSALQLRPMLEAVPELCTPTASSQPSSPRHSWGQGASCQRSAAALRSQARSSPTSGYPEGRARAASDRPPPAPKPPPSSPK